MTALVYLSSPIITYKSPIYDINLARVSAFYPGSQILAARDLYVSHADFLAKWPEHLARLDTLVFFADQYGYIGIGSWQEIFDTLTVNKPVFYLSPEGNLLNDDGFQFVDMRPLSVPGLSA